MRALRHTRSACRLSRATSCSSLSARASAITASIASRREGSRFMDYAPSSLGQTATALGQMCSTASICVRSALECVDSTFPRLRPIALQLLPIRRAKSAWTWPFDLCPRQKFRLCSCLEHHLFHGLITRGQRVRFTCCERENLGGEERGGVDFACEVFQLFVLCAVFCAHLRATVDFVELLDRKSTRLNSSHVAISYAVFCLKKKNTKFSIV